MIALPIPTNIGIPTERTQSAPNPSKSALAPNRLRTTRYVVLTTLTTHFPPETADLHAANPRLLIPDPSAILPTWRV
jgi:hypothetical protein